MVKNLNKTATTIEVKEASSERNDLIKCLD